MWEMAQPIEYERAKLFHRGEWRYLSWQGLLGGCCAAFLVVFGVVFMRIGSRLPGGRLLGWGCIFVGLSGVAALGVLAALDRRRTFEIRSDGIRMNRVLTPWSEVGRFAACGTATSRTVRLFYTSRNGLLRHFLLTNTPTGTSKYEQIVADLRREVGGEHPHLDLGGYEICD
jgi:hypothetical protein